MSCISPQPYSISSCSGNGFLCDIPDIGCICNDGWTSLGDFSFNTSGPECLTNFLGIKIMSYVCIVIPSICNILIVWHYISRAKRKLTCFSWKYQSLFPLNYLLLGISSVIHGILKLSYPPAQQPLIGRDLSITLIAFSYAFNAFCGIVLYINLVLQFLIGNSETMISPESRERVTLRFSTLSFCSWFIIPLSFVFCIMPVIGLSYPLRARAFGITYLIGLAVILFISGLIVMNCLHYLLRELNIRIDGMNGQASDEIKIVVRRLNIAKFVVSGTIFVQGSTCLVFGSSNFLFHLLSYVILFNFTVGPPVALISVLTVSRISRPPRSNQIALISNSSISDKVVSIIKTQKI